MYVAFIDSKGQQWFGGTEGIQVHIGDDPKIDNISWYDELVSPIVHCAAEAPDGKIWVGTEKGISIYDGTNWTILTSNLPDLCVSAIVFNKDGKAVVGTKKGLVILE
jgi:ligand-binding sensor domain-containing protein